MKKTFLHAVRIAALCGLAVIFLGTGMGGASTRRSNTAKKKRNLPRSLAKKRGFKKKKKLVYTSKRSIPSGADKIGAGEHPPALLGLPVDKFGLVDWVQAVKQMKIAPVTYNRTGPEKFYDGTIIYNALNPAWGDVIFDHDVHTYFIDCDSCHPKPFAMQAGKAKIFMMKIKRGKFCGKCHGKIAFPIENCERCHVLPKSNIKW